MPGLYFRTGFCSYSSEHGSNGSQRGRGTTHRPPHQSRINQDKRTPGFVLYFAIVWANWHQIILCKQNKEPEKARFPRKQSLQKQRWEHSVRQWHPESQSEAGNDWVATELSVKSWVIAHSSGLQRLLWTIMMPTNLTGRRKRELIPHLSSPLLHLLAFPRSLFLWFSEWCPYIT